MVENLGGQGGVTICMTVGKAFSLYCRFAVKHKLLAFSKMSEKAFTETGFQNWNKATIQTP